MSNDYKLALLNTGLLHKTGTKYEYSCRCPFCGETSKYGKMYLRIDLDTDDPVPFNCFKCPAAGKQVTDELLELLGVNLNEIRVPRNMKTLKRLNTDYGVSTVVHDPTCCDGDDFSLVHSVLGSSYGLNELQSFQYVGNPGKFVNEYLGTGDDCDGYDVLRNRIWFKMVDGGIIGYDSDMSGKYRVYRCRRLRVGTPKVYQMKTLIDLMDPVNVVICRDILKLIGLYKRIGDDRMENRFYVCSIGETGMLSCVYHMINKGIFGKTINLHFYLGDGEDVYIPKNVKLLFGKIDVNDYESFRRIRKEK